MQPKVFIGCPTWIGKKYCINKYLNGITNLDYPEKYFMIADNSKTDEYLDILKEKGINALKGEHYDDPVKSVVESRNMLREQFLEGDCEYFFSLEQDVVAPRDAIIKMIAHNKRVVSGLYFTAGEVNEKPVMMPLAYVGVAKEFIEKIKADPKVYKDQYEELKKYNFDPKEVKRRLTFKETEGETFMPVLRVGLGCVLIHRDVLEKIKFRYNPHGYDDMTFCSDVLAKNWKIFLDTSIKCRHFIGEQGD
ncbi:MAG: hypothetical protein QF632_01820 [Candidatus Woesearchaeota archaeon]|jgi:hypothetical protein|nr:hypothetical protein [Candidatus Woesearchaeota archaeon]MDP7323479.1 hypothetical protein [Candidatus Woesearchaeota archaeon]MDP7457575.1 hypothetical protein [Candidatus Woesearchaeota archaeon]